MTPSTPESNRDSTAVRVSVRGERFRKSARAGREAVGSRADVSIRFRLTHKICDLPDLKLQFDARPTGSNTERMNQDAPISTRA